jgi:hypothetical protein
VPVLSHWAKILFDAATADLPVGDCVGGRTSGQHPLKSIFLVLEFLDNRAASLYSMSIPPGLRAPATL